MTEIELVATADAVGRSMRTLSGEFKIVADVEFKGLRRGSVATFTDGTTEAIYGTRVRVAK